MHSAFTITAQHALSLLVTIIILEPDLWLLTAQQKANIKLSNDLAATEPSQSHTSLR